MNTKKSTIILSLLGIISVIATCVFSVLSFNRVIIMANNRFVEDQVFIECLTFSILAFVFLLISFLSFTAEIYKALGELEKKVYEQRKN